MKGTPTTEADLTLKEAVALRIFIGKVTLGQIPDADTASALRTVYLGLEKAIRETRHEADQG